MKGISLKIIVKMEKIDEIGFIFRELERDLDVYEHKIYDIYFWKLIRVELFKKIVQQLMKYDVSHPDGKIKKGIIQRINKYLINLRLITRNVIFSLSRFQNIVLTSPRKVNYDSTLMCPFTKNLEMKGLNNENSKFLESEYPLNDSQKSNYNYFIAPIALTYLLRKSIFLSKDSKKLILIIERKLINVFGININLEPIVKANISDFIVKYYYALILFKRFKSVKNLFLVTSYGKEGFIAAAKKSGVKTIELQHGIIDFNHPGYSFPIRCVKYLPDKIILFGRYFRKYLTSFEDEQITYDAPYLFKKYFSMKDSITQENTVLIVSDTNQTSSILRDLNHIIDDLDNYNFHLKLHPNEYKTWRTRKTILDFSLKKNTHVIDNDYVHVYERILKSKFLIGTKSTLILESIGLNRKPIILNTKNYETGFYLDLEKYIHRVYEMNEVYLILKKNNHLKINSINNRSSLFELNL